MMRRLRLDEEKVRKEKKILLPKRLGEKSRKKEKNWIISRIAGSYLSGDFKVAEPSRGSRDGSHASLEG